MKSGWKVRLKPSSFHFFSHMYAPGALMFMAPHSQLSFISCPYSAGISQNTDRWGSRRLLALQPSGCWHHSFNLSSVSSIRGFLCHWNSLLTYLTYHCSATLMHMTFLYVCIIICLISIRRFNRSHVYCCCVFYHSDDICWSALGLIERMKNVEGKDKMVKIWYSKMD